MNAEKKSKPLINLDGRDIAKARDAWLASDEGEATAQPYDFTGPGRQVYLKNRLERAFSAGVEAAEQLANEEVKKLGGFSE